MATLIACTDFNLIFIYVYVAVFYYKANMDPATTMPKRPLDQPDKYEEPTPAKRRKFDKPSNIVDRMEGIMDQFKDLLPTQYPFTFLIYGLPRTLLQSGPTAHTAEKSSRNLGMFKDCS
jgi:hypothetical protein